MVSFAIILCACDFNYIRRCDSLTICDTQPCMLLIGRLLFGSILRAFRSRSSLLLENLVLRQQLAVLKRKHPRPQIALVDKLFGVLTRRVWSGWKQALTVVTPDTVVRWHREGFALYWRASPKLGE
jgi:putative transposase